MRRLPGTQRAVSRASSDAERAALLGVELGDEAGLPGEVGAGGLGVAVVAGGGEEQEIDAVGVGRGVRRRHQRQAGGAPGLRAAFEQADVAAPASPRSRAASAAMPASSATSTTVLLRSATAAMRGRIDQTACWMWLLR